MSCEINRESVIKAVQNKAKELLGLGTPLKKGVDFVFEQSEELSKIGTKEQYSQYLDTIFPNSKVKDIVYHGTREFSPSGNRKPEFDVFDKSYIGYGQGTRDGLRGFYFGTKNIADRVGNRIITAILDIQDVNEDTVRRNTEDFGQVGDVFVVFEPEQIHILSSKQDIEGFRNYVNNTFNSRPGVSEVFESNPELANSVYEALGVEVKNFKLIPNNEKHPEDANTYDVIYNDEKIGVVALFEGKSKIIKGVKLDEKFRNKGLGKKLYKFLNLQANLQGGILFSDPEQQSADARRLWGSLIKEGVVNRATADEQSLKFNIDYKQQAQQLYSQYLDTIFPDSKVKDIVYHGSVYSNKQKFKTSTRVSGHYFAVNPKEALQHAQRQLTDPKNATLYGILLGIKNPKVIKEVIDYEDLDTAVKFTKGDTVFGDENDAIIAEKVEEYNTTYKTPESTWIEKQIVVFEPEQIHILGSKADIEGFKEFITNKIQEVNNQFGEELVTQEDGEILISPSDGLIDKYLQATPTPQFNIDLDQYDSFIKKYPKLTQTARTLEQAERSIELVGEINTQYPDLHASIVMSGQEHFIDVVEKSELPQDYKEVVVDKNIPSDIEGDILINKLLTKMKKLFPTFTHEFIDEAQVERLAPMLTQEQVKGTKGFVLGNTVYLVTGKFTPEVIVEEFLHPFVNFLEQDNPLLLENLFQEGLDMYGDLFGVYQSYLESFGEATAKQEVVTRALSYLVKDLEENKSPQKKSLLKRFTDWLKSLFSRTGIKTSGYPTSLTLRELANQISDSEHTLNYVTSQSSNFNITDKVKTRWEQIGKIISNNGIRKIGDKEGYVNSKGEKVKRITDIVKEKNKKFFSQGENDFTAEERAEFDLMAERGTNFHKDIENMFRRYIDVDTGLKKNPDDVSIENFQAELKILPAKKDAYIEKLDMLVQNMLNTYSDDTRFRFETIVYNSKKKVAGTIDFIAVRGDGNIDIIDWKSIFSLEEGRIPGYKKTGFNTQLTEYRDAIKDQLLLTNEDFGKLRVIPILPTIQQGTGIITDIKIGTVKPEDEVLEALYPILTEGDEAFSKEAKSLVAAFNDIIKSESNRLSKESGYERKDYELQNELDDAIRNLLVAKNPDRLYAFIKTTEERTKRYLKEVADFIKNNPNPTQQEEKDFSEKMQNGVHSLRALKAFTTFSSPQLKEIISDPEQEIIYLKIKEDINKLNINLDEGLKLFVKKFGDNYGILRIDSAEVKIGFFAKWTRQLSNSAIKSTLLFEKMVRPVLNSISVDKQSIQFKWSKRRNELVEWGRQNGKSLKEVYETFLDTYDNKDNPLYGKYNGMFKSTISKEFTQLKKDVQIADPKDRIAFYNKFYDLAGYKDAYEQEYKRKAGEILAKVYNTTNEEDNKRQQDRAIKKFKKDFSPNNPETSLFDSNWLLRKFLKIEDPEIQNIYYSEFYKNMLKEENKPLLNAWESMQDVITRAQGTGIDTEIGIDKRFIPRLFKGLVETGLDAKSQKERLVRELSINPDDYNYGSINPSTGKEESNMFLYYSQRLEDQIKYVVKDENGVEIEKTTYDFNSLSTDLVAMFDKFDKNVSYIEHMQGLEAFTEVLSEFEATKRVIDTDRFGRALKEQPIPQGYVGENYKYFDKFRKYYIYNIKLQDVKDKVITLPFKSKGEPVRVSGVKMITNIANFARMTAFSLPNITSPLRNMLLGRLSTVFDQSKYFKGSGDFRNALHFLDNTKLESFTKIMSSEKNQKFAAAITLFLPELQLYENRHSDKLSMNAGWQVLTPERLQVLMQSSEGVIPIAILRAMLENSTVRGSKIQNINILAEEEVKEKYGYNSKYSLPDSLSLDQINKEIKERVKELKKDNLYNYMELTEEGKDKILSIKGVDRNDPSVFEITNIVQNFAQRATGMIPESDISLARTNFLAKQLFMYRGWIPKTVYTRFGGLSYNNLTQSYEQGRMRNLVDHLTKHTESKLDFFKRLVMGFAGFTDKELLIKIAKEHRIVKYRELQELGKDVREMSEEEYVDMFMQNVKNSYQELRILAGLFTIINLGLLAGGEGDDDKEKNLARLAQRELTKYYKELTFYYDPMSAYEIIKNPFPLLSYTGNLLLLSKNILAEPFNPDGNKPTKYFFRSLPIAKEIIGYTPLISPDLAEELGIKINANYATFR